VWPNCHSWVEQMILFSERDVSSNIAAGVGIDIVGFVLKYFFRFEQVEYDILCRLLLVSIVYFLDSARI